MFEPRLPGLQKALNGHSINLNQGFPQGLPLATISKKSDFTEPHSHLSWPRIAYDHANQELCIFARTFKGILKAFQQQKADNQETQLKAQGRCIQMRRPISYPGPSHLLATHEPKPWSD